MIVEKVLGRLFLGMFGSGDDDSFETLLRIVTSSSEALSLIVRSYRYRHQQTVTLLLALNVVFPGELISKSTISLSPTIASLITSFRKFSIRQDAGSLLLALKLALPSAPKPSGALLRPMVAFQTASSSDLLLRQSRSLLRNIAYVELSDSQPPIQLRRSPSCFERIYGC